MGKGHRIMMMTALYLVLCKGRELQFRKEMVSLCVTLHTVTENRFQHGQTALNSVLRKKYFFLKTCILRLAPMLGAVLHASFCIN